MKIACLIMQGSAGTPMRCTHDDCKLSFNEFEAINKYQSIKFCSVNNKHELDHGANGATGSHPTRLHIIVSSYTQ